MTSLPIRHGITGTFAYVLAFASARRNDATISLSRPRGLPSRLTTYLACVPLVTKPQHARHRQDCPRVWTPRSRGFGTMLSGTRLWTRRCHTDDRRSADPLQPAASGGQDTPYYHRINHSRCSLNILHFSPYIVRATHTQAAALLMGGQAPDAAPSRPVTSDVCVEHTSPFPRSAVGANTAVTASVLCHGIRMPWLVPPQLRTQGPPRPACLAVSCA